MGTSALGADDGVPDSILTSRADHPGRSETLGANTLALGRVDRRPLRGHVGFGDDGLALLERGEGAIDQHHLGLFATLAPHVAGIFDLDVVVDDLQIDGLAGLANDLDAIPAGKL